MNALLGNFELAVISLYVLFRYVLGDDLVRNIPARRHKVASRPQVTPPKRPVQRSEVPHEPVRTATLDGVHDSARRKRRRHAEQQMHMIWSDMPLQNLDVPRLADLPDYFSQVLPHLPSQDRLAVLWDENEMVMTLKDRVRPVAVCSHLPKVPQASSRRRLKARGFTHPRWGP